MLTLEEIKKSNVDMEIIREAHKQSEDRLKDYLGVMKDINQKTFILFNSFLTILILLISAAFIVHEKETIGMLFDWITVFVPFIFCSLIFFLIALHNFEYGCVGSAPSMWLEKGTIDGKEVKLANKLAEITYYHEHRIDVSLKSNGIKLKFQEAGVYMVLIGIVASAIIYPFHLFSPCLPYRLLSVVAGGLLAYLIADKT